MITDINGISYEDKKIQEAGIDFMNRKNQEVEFHLRALLEGMTKDEINSRCNHYIEDDGSLEQWVLDDTIILECEFIKPDKNGLGSRLEVRRFKND